MPAQSSPSADEPERSSAAAEAPAAVPRRKTKDETPRRTTREEAAALEQKRAMDEAERKRAEAAAAQTAFARKQREAADRTRRRKSQSDRDRSAQLLAERDAERTAELAAERHRAVRPPPRRPSTRPKGCARLGSSETGAGVHRGLRSRARRRAQAEAEAKRLTAERATARSRAMQKAGCSPPARHTSPSVSRTREYSVCGLGRYQTAQFAAALLEELADAAVEQSEEARHYRPHAPRSTHRGWGAMAHSPPHE